MIRCSVLSDPRVIELINKDMIPISINASHKGFPTEEFAAVKPMKTLYKTSDHWEKGFASISLLDPNGKNILGGLGLLNPRVSDLLTYEGFITLVEKSYIRWIKLKKMDDDFKKGNIFSGIGGVLSITKEEFGKAANAFSDIIELGEQLKASDVKEDHFKELKCHGVRRSDFKGFPNISSITPRVLENGTIVDPSMNIAVPTIIPNQSAPNIPSFPSQSVVFATGLGSQQGSSAPLLYPDPKSNYNTSYIQVKQVNTYTTKPQILQPIIYQIKLPVGWETKTDPKSGRLYYIDHNTRTTHWNPPSI